MAMRKMHIFMGHLMTADQIKIRKAYLIFVPISPGIEILCVRISGDSPMWNMNESRTSVIMMNKRNEEECV